MIISHDRSFLDDTVNKLLVFENDNKILKFEGNFSDYYEKFGLEKLKKLNIRNKRKILSSRIHTKKINNKNKLSFKDVYDLKNLPKQIEKFEQSLKEHEAIISRKNLFKNDRKTFDNVANEITNIKSNISKAEDKWLELQILNDEINNKSK